MLDEGGGGHDDVYIYFFGSSNLLLILFSSLIFFLLKVTGHSKIICPLFEYFDRFFEFVIKKGIM